MSRVYDTPRYEDQTLNKVLLHLDVGRERLGYSDLRPMFGNPRALEKTFDSVKYELQQQDILDAEEAMCMAPDEIESVDFYLQYCLSDAVSRQGSEHLLKTISTGKAIHDILTSMKGKKIWCDYDASIRMTHAYLSSKVKGSLADKDRKMMQYSSGIAKDILVLSLSACRLGSKILEIAKDRINTSFNAPSDWMNMICWNRGMELLRLKSMTPGIYEAHEDIRNGSTDIEYTRFSALKTKAARTLNCKNLYRIMGMYFLEYEDECYVLDFSSLDQVHQVSKMWEGFFKYGYNYRVSGNGKCKREITSLQIRQCRDWICDAIVESGFSDKLARCMKQSLALMQNNMHAKAERLNVNLEVKSNKLESMIREVLRLKKYWHEHLASLNVNERVQMDLANMFYALPAPDCNLSHLFKRASTYMQEANKANDLEFHDFMKYCMAIDLAKAVCVYRSDVTFESVPGYNVREQPWYKRCLKGKLTIPPDEDFGKAWISKFFPFNNTLPQWYWEAADVTHVLAESEHYESLPKFAKLDRSSHNELLYALDYAPKLSYKWSPDDVMLKLGSGMDKWDRMAVMAVKCENTKPGAKCRETWSADDITRELTTCYDRAAIPLASIYEGVTARKSDIAVQSIFDRICSMTRKDNPKKIIIMSNDVSGWSPLGDREAWSMHHDYIIRTTKAPSNLRLRDVWKNINAYLSKRGVIAACKLDKGLFQGWTGTCDSLFNVHISHYCVRKAKRAGFLIESEGAKTAGLIDDAVQAVELDPKSTMEHQQSAADNHFDITAETWKSLGAELDIIKTIYSSCKFIYLNRFFCEGSEVFVPMKIFARADKEFNRRFATIFAQMDTVLGSYRSSVDKGCCPISAYYFAICRCIDLVCYSNSSITTKDSCAVLNACFAPRSLGGWGIPHITAWLTQEAQDSLAMYTYTMSSVIDMCTDKIVADKFNDLLMGTLNQEMELVSIQALIEAPKTVVAAGIINPEGQVYRKIKKGMLSRCKSSVFRSALNAGCSSESLELLSRLVRCCRWDASILELLGQCLPSSCSSALIDRAYKNELVTQLFPYRVRSEMSSIIKKGSGQSVVFLVNKSFGSFDVKATRSMAYYLALDCRARFYEKNCVEVTNHTIPDYGTCLARQYPGENPGIIVKSVWPNPSCESIKEATRNMYDGIAPKEKSRTPRGTSAYTFTGERFRYMTPVQRCINKAAIVSAYLSNHDGNGKFFWDLVMAMWGASHVVTPPVVTTQVKPGTSTKRLDPSRTHLTHSISCYKNVHNCIDVIAEPIGSYLSAKSTHVDYLSIVTAARVVALLNLSISNGEESLPELHFGFLEGSIPLTEDDKLVLFDAEEASKTMTELMKISDKTLFVHVTESMVDLQYSMDSEEEYICIGFRDEHMGTIRTGQELSIAAGYISNIINCGVVSTMAERKRTALVRTAGDEIISRPTLKADTRMRIISRGVPRSQAVLCLAMETVRDLTPGGVRMNIAQAPWKFVPREFQATFPDWGMYWDNVVRLMQRYTMSIDMEACRSLLGHVPYHIVSHLANLDGRINDSSLVVVSYLYLASYGRLRSPESYTLTSALGVQQMSRCWHLAARIRQEPSRKYPVNSSRERELMGSIYHALALATQNYHNKVQVLRAIHTGMRNHLLRFFNSFELDAPDFDNRFLAAPPLDNGYWLDLRDNLLQQVRPLRLNNNYLCEQLNNIANDIFVLGETRALSMVQEPRLVQPSEPMSIQIELPTLTSMEIEEQEEESQEFDNNTMNATVAYLEQGIDYGALVYAGEEAFEREYDPSEEDIMEFLTELRIYEEPQAGGQMPDEVID